MENRIVINWLLFVIYFGPLPLHVTIREKCKNAAHVLISTHLRSVIWKIKHLLFLHNEVGVIRGYLSRYGVSERCGPLIVAG